METAHAHACARLRVQKRHQYTQQQQTAIINKKHAVTYVCTIMRTSARRSVLLVLENGVAELDARLECDTLRANTGERAVRGDDLSCSASTRRIDDDR